MKFFLFFFLLNFSIQISLEDFVGAKCACGSLDEKLNKNPYSISHGALYHQILKQQMFYFSKLWSQQLNGLMVGQGRHMRKILKLEIEEYDFDSFENTAKINFFNTNNIEIDSEYNWLNQDFKGKNELKGFFDALTNENQKKQFDQELNSILSICKKDQMDSSFEDCVKYLNKNSVRFFFGMKLKISYQKNSVQEWKIVTVLQFTKKEDGTIFFYFQPYLIREIDSQMDSADWRINFYEALKNKHFYASEKDYSKLRNYFKNKAIRVSYNGFYTQQNQNEIVTSCRFGYNVLKSAIQTILQIEEFPTMKLNFCPKPINLFKYPKNNKFYLNPEITTLLKQQEEQPQKIDLTEEIKQYNLNMEYKDAPINLELRYQDQIDKVYYDRQIIEEFASNQSSNVEYNCETFQRAREYNYFIQKQQMTSQYLNLSPNFEIVCLKETENQAFSTRAIVFYFDTIIGYIDFEQYLDKEDPCTIPYLCIDFEANFGSKIISQLNCQRRASLDWSLLPENNGLFQYFHHLIYNSSIQIIETSLNELEVLNSMKIGIYDLVHNFLQDYEFQYLKEKYKLNLIFDSSYQQEKFDHDFFYLGNFKGGLLLGFFENFEYSPIYISIYDYLWEGYIKIEIKCGTKYFKMMLPNQIFISKQDIEIIEKQIKNFKSKEDMITQRKALFKKIVREKINKSYFEIIKNYFIEILTSNETLIYNNLASSVVNNTQSPDVIYPIVLKKYLNTGLIGFPVLVSLFNYVLMNFSFDRISTKKDFNIQQLIDEFDLMMKNKTIESQKAFWDKYMDLNATISDDTYPEEFQQEQKNSLGFNDLSQWVYVLESQEKIKKEKHDLGYLEHIIEDFERINESEVITFEKEIEKNSKLVIFDLRYLKEKQILFDNNYFIGLFGNREFQRKMIFECFFYKYDLLTAVHIKFQTYNFTSEYILPINSYVDILLDFQEISKNVKNHGLLTVQQSEKTLANQYSVKFQQIYKSLLKVLKDINQVIVQKQEELKKHDRLLTLCQDPESYSERNSESNIIVLREKKFLDEKMEQIFTGDCEEGESAIQFLKIEEQEELIKVTIFEFRKYQSILESKKIGQKVTRNFISTYEFHRKAAYNILPVFERQIYCLIYHAFLGKFCEKEIHWEDFVHEVNLEKHHQILDEKAEEEKKKAALEAEKLKEASEADKESNIGEGDLEKKRK